MHAMPTRRKAFKDLKLRDFQDSVAVELISLLAWDVTERRLVDTDVSGQPSYPIFKRQSSFA